MSLGNDTDIFQRKMLKKMIKILLQDIKHLVIYGICEMALQLYCFVNKNTVFCASVSNRIKLIHMKYIY